MKKQTELVLICVFLALTAYYYKGNVSKIKYIDKKFFKEPFQSGYFDQANIVHVVIKSPSYFTRKSFIKDAAVTRLGKYLLFMELPSDVNLEDIADYIFIDDTKVPAALISDGILMVSHNNIRTYIMNKNYKENMASILEMEKK
jgi:hypothetical protein